MIASTTTSRPPGVPTLADWIDHAEAALDQSTQHQLADDVVLAGYAQAWRTWVAGLAAMPPELRRVAAFPELGRGTATAGGLGTDYPTGLLEFIRTSWTNAARGLAVQQAVMPYGLDESRRLHRLATGLETTPPPAFAPTPNRVVRATVDYRLREILPDTLATGEPILIVSSLINRWYILDFHTDQSFVAMLRGFGRPVYVLEWQPPAHADDRGLGELCAGPVLEVTDWIRARHEVPSIAVIGYSMGGTVATCLASRYPDRVSRLATVCAPIQFERGGSFAQWLSARFVDVDLVSSAWSRIPAALVHAPFWWLRPSIKFHKLALLARAFERPHYIDHFLATEVWNHDNVDLSRGVFRSWVGDLYQRNALVNGTMSVGGEAIHPRRISCPVLIISGASDNIAPPEAAEGLREACAPGKARVVRLDVGHVGVLTSRRALATAGVQVKAWLDSPCNRPS